MDLSPIAVVPIVVALVAVLKSIPAVKDRTWLLPILAMLVGIAVTTLSLIGWPPVPVVPIARLVAIALLSGAVNGLAGAGLYDAGKGVIEKATQ